MKYNELNREAQKKAYNELFFSRKYRIESEVLKKGRDYAEAQNITYDEEDDEFLYQEEGVFLYLDDHFLESIYKKTLNEEELAFITFLKMFTYNETAFDGFDGEDIVYPKADMTLQCDEVELYWAERRDIIPDVTRFFPHLMEKYKVRNIFHQIQEKKVEETIIENLFGNERMENEYYDYDSKFLNDLEKEMNKTRARLWEKVNSSLQEIHQDILEYTIDIEHELMDKYFEIVEFEEDGTLKEEV